MMSYVNKYGLQIINTVIKTYLISILTAYSSFCNLNNFNVLTNVWYRVLQAFSHSSSCSGTNDNIENLVLNIWGTSIQYTYDLYHGYTECCAVIRLQIWKLIKMIKN
jgi:hypothetical protein